MTSEAPTRGFEQGVGGERAERANGNDRVQIPVPALLTSLSPSEITRATTESELSALMIEALDAEISDAVQWYWATLSEQGDAQRESENSARGRRAQVLGGDQMSAFEGLLEDVLVDEGLPRDSIVHDHAATLPGYYRPTKRWDTAVVHDGQLLAAIECKSIASSFGNNLNNRAEEAIGSNTDLYQAYEEGVFEPSPAPWIGYLILMADNQKSNNVPRLHEPNFEADDEFQRATYIDASSSCVSEWSVSASPTDRRSF